MEINASAAECFGLTSSRACLRPSCDAIRQIKSFVFCPLQAGFLVPAAKAELVEEARKRSDIAKEVEKIDDIVIEMN